MAYFITQPRILYVLKANDRKHKGLLKIGEFFVNSEIVQEYQDMDMLFNLVEEKLKQTNWIKNLDFEIVLAMPTTYSSVNGTDCFKARTIIDILSDSGYRPHYLKNEEKKIDLWMPVTLTQVNAAIKAATNGRKTIEGRPEPGIKPIDFRPEQTKAIEDAINRFSTGTGKKFLWNAKMRFGKTLSALEVARRLGESDPKEPNRPLVKTILIVTHRPVVDKDWREDFKKIFFNQLDTYTYGSRNLEDKDSDGDFYSLLKGVETGKRLVFFVSMQFLRLSKLVGGSNEDPLKYDIMNYDWDMVVVDEAHEGTKTNLGYNVLERLVKTHTVVLHLSGTPFNLYENFSKKEIYTWDYISEQQAKIDWAKNHYEDPNPYIELPKLNLFTLSLSKAIGDTESQGEISFRELFKVSKADGKVIGFVHEDKVRKFLDSLISSDEKSNYPFSRPEFQQKFQHSFWVVPGINEAEALKKELERHPVFMNFKILNISGNGDYEDQNNDAYKTVKQAIACNDYTITISVNKLTVGVTIPEWTAILYLKGNMSTSAASYMQTIFRCQSSGTLEGETKTNCYVFDFLPDRAIQAISYTLDQRYGKNKKQKALEDFIEVCPIASLDSGEMIPYDVRALLDKLNQISGEKYKVSISVGQVISQFPEIEHYVNLALQDKKSKIIAIDNTGEVLYDNTVATLYQQIIKRNNPALIRELGISVYCGNIISSFDEMSENPKMNKDFNALLKKMESGKPHDPICIIDDIEYYLLTQYPTDMKFTRLSIINKRLNLGYKLFMTTDHNNRNDDVKIICSL